MRRGPRPGRWGPRLLVRLLPIACGAVALGAAAVGVRFAQDGRAPAAAQEGGAASERVHDSGSDAPEQNAGGAQDAVENEGPREDVQGLLERARALFSGPVATSGPARFLDDLNTFEPAESDEGTAEGGTMSVQWKAPSDIPAAAEPVLQAYAQRGGAQLLASGYLDVRGNVWGAVVRKAAAQDGGSADSRGEGRSARDEPERQVWCDVVLVSTNDGQESVVRVARVHGGA